MIFTSFHIDHSTKDQLYLLDVVSLSRYLFMASLRLAFTIYFRYFSKSCYPFLYWISLLNEVVLEELFGHRHIPRAAYTTRWAMRNHFHFSTRDVARFPSTPIHTWHASTFLWICAVRPGLLWMVFSLFVTTISHKAFLSDSYGFCGRKPSQSSVCGGVAKNGVWACLGLPVVTPVQSEDNVPPQVKSLSYWSH